jgi:hypothetical protein
LSPDGDDLASFDVGWLKENQDNSGFGYKIPNSPRATETLELATDPAQALPDDVDQLEPDAAFHAPTRA